MEELKNLKRMIYGGVAFGLGMIVFGVANKLWLDVSDLPWIEPGAVALALSLCFLWQIKRVEL